MEGILLIAISSILLLGCDKQEKEETKEAYSFELKLSEAYDPTWEELGDIIELAAIQGHPELLINGTYIYLPPIQPYGKGTKEIPTNPKTMTIEGMRDHGENDSYRVSANLFDLDRLKRWIRGNDLEAVRLSISNDVSITPILSAIDLLNENKIHVKLMRKPHKEDSTMTFTECVVRPLPIKNDIEQVD